MKYTDEQTTRRDKAVEASLRAMLDELDREDQRHAAEREAIRRRHGDRAAAVNAAILDATHGEDLTR